MITATKGVDYACCTYFQHSLAGFFAYQCCPTFISWNCWQPHWLLTTYTIHLPASYTVCHVLVCRKPVFWQTAPICFEVSYDFSVSTWRVKTGNCYVPWPLYIFALRVVSVLLRRNNCSNTVLAIHKYSSYIALIFRLVIRFV